MTTKMEKLLQDIHPSNTIDEIEKSINRAVVSYHRDKNKCDSWEECEECLIDMAHHLHTVYYNLPKNYKPKIGYGDARYWLEQEYGSSEIAFNIMLSGAEGGIHAILKTLARLMIEDFSRSKIDSIVNDYYKSVNIEKIIDAAKEYIKLNKHILPKDKDTHYRIIQNFYKTLVEHPFLVKKMRSL